MATRKKKAAPEAADAVEQTAAVDTEAENPTAVPEAQDADAGHFDRATLQDLSTDALKALAENMGATVPDPEDREALIGIIAGEDATASVPDGAEDAETPEAQAPPSEAEPEAQSVPTEAEPEADTPPPEQAVPYDAVTVPPVLVVRKEPDGPAVATLPRGATIRVTGRRDGHAQMRNGLYVRESMIRPV